MKKLDFYNNFKYRFTKDPLVTYYTNEEFNVNRTPIELDCDGNILRGYDYNPNPEIEDAIIIFAQGMWTTIDAYNQDICYLCNAGFEVIGINNTGVDISDGKNLIGLGASLKALDYTVRYVKSQIKYKDRKIYVIGHSWGGYAVMNIMKYHPDIAKICDISGFVSEYRLYKSMLPKSVRCVVPFLVIRDYFHLGTYAIQNSIKNLNKFKGKALIIHAKNDPLVNYEMHAKVLKEKVKNAKFIISENRCHNPNYTDESVLNMRNYLDKLRNQDKETQDKIKKETDFRKLGELDPKVMDEIVSFFKEN